MLLSAEGVSVTLPGDAGLVRVLDGVSLELGAGELADVSGPSGAGKTTLLRALARLLPVGEGSLALDGRASGEVPAQEWRMAVAMLPQKPVMFPGSVRDNLRAPWTLRVRSGAAGPDDAALACALAAVGVEAALDRDACRLSLGQQARVAMLRVLLTEPRALLLDEPDANLDDESAEQVGAMTQAFAARGGGVLRVRHLRRDATASRRFRLTGGRLTEEAP